MTIYLPEEIPNFRKALDETCDRILQSKNDTVFYELLIQLVATLREHSPNRDKGIFSNHAPDSFRLV